MKKGIDRIKYINKETNEVIGYVDYDGRLPEGMYYALKDSVDDLNRAIGIKLTNVLGVKLTKVRSITSDDQAMELYGNVVVMIQMAVDLLAVAKFYKREFDDLFTISSYFSYNRIEKAITKNFDTLESASELLLDYLSDHGYDVEEARNIRDYKSPIKLQ